MIQDYIDSGRSFLEGLLAEIGPAVSLIIAIILVVGIVLAIIGIVTSLVEIALYAGVVVVLATGLFITFEFMSIKSAVEALPIVYIIVPGPLL